MQRIQVIMWGKLWYHWQCSDRFNSTILLLDGQYWDDGPQHWQPVLQKNPQNPQFAAGIWQYCGVWKRGKQGGVKRGGGGTEKGEIEWGWVDVGLAPDCEFLSVKFDDSLDETLSLGQSTSSLSSFTSTSSNFSSFLMTTSSFTFKGAKADSFDCNSASLAQKSW